MATIVGRIATSHTPTIGFALDTNKQTDPVWAPIFAGYEPVQRWLADKKPDVRHRTPFRLSLRDMCASRHCGSVWDKLPRPRPGPAAESKNPYEPEAALGIHGRQPTFARRRP